jgi:hypothetical protein
MKYKLDYLLDNKHIKINCDNMHDYNINFCMMIFFSTLFFYYRYFNIKKLFTKSLKKFKMLLEENFPSRMSRGGGMINLKEKNH